MRTSGQAVDISPAVNDLALPEVVAADVLTERVMTEGKVLPGNLLKVYSFINHQVDVVDAVEVLVLKNCVDVLMPNLLHVARARVSGVWSPL